MTGWIDTYLPTGHRLHAVPEPDEDVVGHWHDLIHLLLAKAAGQPVSAALLRAAGVDACTDEQLAHEEAAVLALQAWLRSLEK